MVDNIINVLNDFEISFDHEEQEGTEIFIFDLTLDNGIYRGVVELNPERQFIIVAIFYTTPLPVDNVDSILEFITRLNNLHTHGTLVYDFEDHSICSQYCFYYLEENIESLEMQLAQSIHSRSVILDFYLPGILSVAHSDKRPLDVINELELNTDPRLN